MKNPLFLIGLIIFLLVSCHKAGQDTDVNAIPSMHVSSELSNQRVTAFAEDSLGHIWIGTFRGLNRYNSLDFHQYFCTDSCIDLPDNQICALFNDSRHRLWVATINGIAVYDNNDHFRTIPSDNPSLPTFTQILESPDKKIYVNGRTRLDLYDETARKLRTVIPSLSGNDRVNVWCHFDRRNKLWVIDNKTLRCFRHDTYQIIDSIEFPSAVQAHFMDIDNDRLWLGGDKYLGLYDIRNRKFITPPALLAKQSSLADANITNIYRYEEGYWLFNTADRGLIVYNSASDRIWEEGENGYPFDLPGFRMQSFFTDSNKNLWVGSYDQGMAIINKYKRQFNSDITLHAFLNRSSVNSVDYDKEGNIWMTTLFDGVLVYNTSGATSKIKPGELSEGNRPAHSFSVVKIARDGQVWIASLLDSKAWRCSWAGGRLKVNKEYSIPFPLSIIEDAQGGLWVGSGQKWLMRYNSLTDNFDSVDIGLGPDDDCFVSGLADAGDKLYVAAFKRPLMQAAFENNKIKIDTVRIEGWDKMISRGHFMPTDMLYDSFGELWIGTVGNGLLRYNPETKLLSKVNDVPCTDISSIEEDKYGNLWIATQYGLSRYIRSSGRVQTYYMGDGTGGNQFYDRSSVTTPWGTIMFGGTHGLTSFNPAEVGVKRKMPLVFEDLKIHNIIIDPLYHPEILAEDLGRAKMVNLNQGQNSFSISFAALDYSSFVKPRYSYILENHDPYWIEDRQTNEACYTNLPPGDYTLRVRLTDHSETLVGEELSIPIHVKGNPWTSWWAIVLYVLAAVGLAYVMLSHVNKMPVRLKVVKNPPKGEECPAPKSALSASDEKFMQELRSIMESEIANPDIDINKLTEMMRISRTKLYYKVKSLTGQNPSVFFKTYKLDRAAQLLREGKYSVWEIAEMTGFSTTAHFSTSFKKKFGKTPTEYAR